MSVCSNLIAICSKTHLPCPYVSTHGECAEASCVNAVIPTWSDLLDIYRVAVNPKRGRLGQVACCLRTITKTLGVGMDDKVIVSAEQMDEVHRKLLADRQPETVSSVFCAVKACTSRSKREIRLEYRKRGKQVPDIDIPLVKVPPKPIYRLTEAQRIAIREEMARRRTSKRTSDRNRYVWLWFEWNFGVRPIDVENLKWKCIQRQPDGSTRLDYIPTKTEDKTGKHAGCELTETQIEEIRPFIGAPEEYVIPRCENRRPKTGKVRVKHGDYVGRHQSLRNYAIAFMRSIGVTANLPQYQLRKDCSQTTIANRGILHEAAMLGHTPKIALNNYTDITKLKLKEGL